MALQNCHFTCSLTAVRRGRYKGYRQKIRSTIASGIAASTPVGKLPEIGNSFEEGFFHVQ
jgi:hypothetical protein